MHAVALAREHGDRFHVRLLCFVSVVLSDSGRLERHRHELSGLAGRLDALSPLRILERGYALARDEQGRVLKRVVQFPLGLRFRLRVTDGEVAARAEES